MSSAAERSVAIAPELADALNDAVAAGDYDSVDAAVREALLVWKERRENFGYTIDELKALLQESEDGGPLLSADDVFDKLLGSSEAKAS